MRTTFVGLVLAISLTGSLALAQTTVPPPRTAPVNPPRVQIQPPRAVTTLACTEDDCDRDGHIAIARGGDDCNDNDATTYPGRAEVGDPGHDEDCDYRSYGVLDADSDGFGTDRFYNTAPDGTRHGGRDCNDGEAGIRPTAQELPNRIDDDCDGVVDDLVGVWYTPR